MVAVPVDQTADKVALSGEDSDDYEDDDEVALHVGKAP